MNVAILPEVRETRPERWSTQLRSILVVEDEPSYARFLQSLFEDAGYRVRTARGAEAALALVTEEAPDLVTLDLMMPGVTGIKLFGRLRRQKELRDTRIIIITGLDHGSKGLCTYRQFFRSHAFKNPIEKPDAYLTKPVEPEELLATVRRVLDTCEPA